MKRICTVLVFLWFSLNCFGQILAGKKPNEIANLVLLDSTRNLLIEPAQVSEVRIAKIDSVYYDVLLDDDGRIKFISTGDSKFKSKEGAMIGNTFRLLTRKYGLKKKDVVKYPGWGNVLRLASGWFAVFDFTEPVQPHSRVLFFYQMNP